MKSRLGALEATLSPLPYHIPYGVPAHFAVAALIPDAKYSAAERGCAAAVRNSSTVMAL